MKKTIFALLTFCIINFTHAQTANTDVTSGQYQISTATTSDSLYLTGGLATLTGTTLTFAPLISPASDIQVWNVTKGASGNATDKYFIKSKNEGIPINTQGVLKLTASGGIPVADGKFHAHTFYRIGDIYAVKVAAGVADATTTYSAKFWNITNSNLSLTTTPAAYPATADYVIKFIPYQPTGITTSNTLNVKYTVTSSGITIHTDVAGELTIFNINGQLTKESAIIGSKSIDLPKGLYIVRIKNTNSVFVKKITIL
ncbi:MAG: T9SS type A sorting domain-containing protein [Bacteroidales bacterium]|nr:T9SS type A sorting domain-containing protein [Bacteroidales bacterium]